MRFRFREKFISRNTIELTENPEIVNWPETYYAFIEERGPFIESAPRAWQALHKLTPTISEHNKIIGYMSLYKVEPKIYRAGVAVAAKAQNLPAGAQSMLFPGGKYSRFILTGAYSNLPQASARVFEILAERKIPMRDAFCIENYVNNPRNTPEERLITEIVIPTV